MFEVSIGGLKSMEMSKNIPFVQALGRVPSGLFIVTAAAGDKRAGYLASFVQQVSIDPLLFMVACHPDRYPYQLIKKAQRFGLSIIPKNDRILMRTFAKGHGPDDNPLLSVSLEVMHGVPLLKDALGGIAFDVVEEVKPGDHVLFIGKPVDGVLFDSDVKPWVHVRTSALNY